MSLAIRSNQLSKRSSCGSPSIPAMSEHPRTRPAQTAQGAAEGVWAVEAAVLGLVSTRNPYRPAVLAAGGPGNGLEWRPRRAHGHSGRNPNSQHKPPEPKPRKGLSRARSRTDNATRRPNPGIACPQHDRAQNPVNTTRTCNKLRPVDWFTGEVN